MKPDQRVALQVLRHRRRRSHRELADPSLSAIKTWRASGIEASSGNPQILHAELRRRAEIGALERLVPFSDPWEQAVGGRQRRPSGTLDHGPYRWHLCLSAEPARKKSAPL